MKRKLYDFLLKWKKEGGRSALLIRGARRVGKSYIAEEFAKREYRSYILIDFAQIGDDVKDLIVKALSDHERLFNYLQLTFGKKLYKRESVIIFDEVQKCPKVREAIKYLVADGRYDYLETGSLLSIDENVKDIVIPSEEDQIDLNPMDFEEFLWAYGQEGMMDYIRECFATGKGLEQSLHRKVMTMFREYMIVGGMPQAVKEFMMTHDFLKVETAKKRILTLYRADIPNHAGNLRYKVESVWDNIPAELSRHEKKFRLSDLDKNARSRDYTEAFVWLNDAKVVNLCFNSTEPNIGLGLSRQNTKLKCYMADTGLLVTHAFGENDTARADICRKLIMGKLEVNGGMLAENIVAQMLVAAGHKLFFYSKSDRKEKENRMEIDFLTAKSKVTSRHNISFIEVKSSSRYTLTSLNKAKIKYDKFMNDAIVLHSGDYKKENGITFLPIYMASLL